LDKAVIEISELLQDVFQKDIEIRFNSDCESGGAYIKDYNFSCKIGICAKLASSMYKKMSKEEKLNLSIEDIQKLPKDKILYHVVLDKSFMKGDGENDKYRNFKSLDEAYDWLTQNMNTEETQKYLKNLRKYKKAVKPKEITRLIPIDAMLKKGVWDEYCNLAGISFDLKEDVKNHPEKYEGDCMEVPQELADRLGFIYRVT